MVYIIIPVHNRKQHTQACLQSLCKQAYRNFKTIVVDDGSTDGTSDMIRQEFPEVTILTGDGNLWWAESTNVGVRYAMQHSVEGEDNFVLTLNDDLVVKTDYIHTLLAAYDECKPCIVGSACVDIKNPNRLEYAGSKINLLWSGETHLANLFARDYQRIVSQKKIVDSDTLTGRGVLIPFEVFLKIGFYDAVRFKQYMADIEFSVRARKAGYKLVVSIPSVVYSHVDATGLQIKPDMSFGKFWRGLSSIKSPINLSARYYFAMRHAPTKWLYFLLDVGRIFTGYFIRRFQLK